MPDESLATRPLTGPDLRLEPSAACPLGGLVVLAVEDSRYASDALRLCFHRLGARLRRADSMQVARAHLAHYRPDLMLVDYGLPDGPGTELVAAISARPDRPAIVGHSGDHNAEAELRSSGADGFIAKPLPSLAVLCDTVTALVPGRGLRGTLPDRPLPVPDPLALRDDLRHAASLIGNRSPAAARFVATLAAATGDTRLAAAASAPAAALARAVQDRLARLGDPFRIDAP